MSYFSKQSKKLMDYFIGDTLANTNDSLERSKIELFYWFCLLNIGLIVSMIPILLSKDSFFQLSLASSIGFILIGILYSIKLSRTYKTSLYFIAALCSISAFSIIIFIAPQNLASILSFIYITICLVIFTINNKAAFTLVFATILAIGISAYLRSNGIHSGALLGATMNDITELRMATVLLIGAPMIILTIGMSSFVRINRKANDELVENIALQEALNTDLQSSREQFKTLVEAAEDLVYELSPDGNFNYVNPAFEKLTGYDLNFIKGLQYTYLLHPSVVEQSRSYFEKKSYTNSNKSYQEFPIQTRQGKTVWIGHKTNVVLDKEGNIVKCFCIGRDITQQKEIRANLEKAKAEAEKAAMVKAQFLSAMSHEIRTPINAVLGTIHLMADEKPRLDQVPHLNTLKFSAENLMNLVSHILDYNKLDADKISIKEIPFKLNECLTHTKAGVEHFAKEKGIGFSFEIDPKLPETLIGDSFRVSQVLSNLAHNAVKFTESGGVTIQVLEHLRTDEFVQVYFSVTDTGKGIRAEKLDLIFEKFTQATDETVLEGTGLGLAISAKIAVLLKAKITVESTLGVGSKFSFIAEFPRVQQSKPEVPQIQKGLQVKTQNNLEGSLTDVKILLVEDNIINQKVAGKLLSRWGAEYDIAANGQIAVDKIQINHYDIVLMDIQMPVMDGIKATTTIRSLGGKYSKIPIIALTASAVLEVRQNALEAGLDDFLTKPFQPENLNKTILKHLNKSKKVGEKAVISIAEMNYSPGPGE